MAELVREVLDEELQISWTELLIRKIVKEELEIKTAEITRSIDDLTKRLESLATLNQPKNNELPTQIVNDFTDVKATALSDFRNRARGILSRFNGFAQTLSPNQPTNCDQSFSHEMSTCKIEESSIVNRIGKDSESLTPMSPILSPNSTLAERVNYVKFFKKKSIVLIFKYFSESK